MAPITAHGLVLTAPGYLELCEFRLPDPGPGEVRLRVAGCGLCHTDITFYSGAVSTRQPVPVVLGHEIAGTIEAAGPGSEHLVGCDVVVPAVLPCGACPLCAAGRDTACATQVMPGNHIDGGFATHVLLPDRHLVPVGDLDGHRLAELAVVADAVTTPYQALARAGTAAGDLVVVIGIGGIGTFAVQIARALGARVAAVDVDPAKLERAVALGAAWTFGAPFVEGRAIKKTLAAESGVCTARWRILEMSGTAAGQELAWALLPPAGTLVVVGYTTEMPRIRLSNLMALDATAIGTWGCSPRHYPAALDLVRKGRVQLRPFVELHPLARGPELFAEIARGGGPRRRPILVPE